MAKNAAKTTLNLGALGDQLYAKNEEISQANAVVKDLENEKKELENKLLIAMQEQGTDMVRGDTATVSISELVKPRIEDFDEFAKFVKRRSAFHLFERRIASTAYSEMKASLGGKPVPGVSEFTLTRLNIRKR